VPDAGDESRCVLRRKCATCGQRTLHAWIRHDDDPHKNVAEDNDALRARRTADAWRKLREEVARLEDCEIGVEFDDGTVVRPTMLGLITQFLDDGKYLLWLRGDARPEELLAIVDYVWSILWDPQPERWRVQSGKPGEVHTTPFRMADLGKA
jgi:hypothetical protein